MTKMLKKPNFNGEHKIIYTTPEYLATDLIEFLEELVEEDGLALFAIDECHCISSYDFREEYLNYQQLEKISQCTNGSFNCNSRVESDITH